MGHYHFKNLINSTLTKSLCLIRFGNVGCWVLEILDIVISSLAMGDSGGGGCSGIHIHASCRDCGDLRRSTRQYLSIIAHFL